MVTYSLKIRYLLSTDTITDNNMAHLMLLLCSLCIGLFKVIGNRFGNKKKKFFRSDTPLFNSALKCKLGSISVTAYIPSVRMCMDSLCNGSVLVWLAGLGSLMMSVGCEFPTLKICKQAHRKEG